MVQFTDFYRKFTLSQLTLHSASSFERPYPARSESDDFKRILNLQVPSTRVGTACVQEFWNTSYLTPSTHLKNLRHAAIYRIKPYRGRRDLTSAVIHRSFLESCQTTFWKSSWITLQWLPVKTHELQYIWGPKQHPSKTAAWLWTEHLHCKTDEEWRQFNVPQMSRDSNHSTCAFYFCSIDWHTQPPFLIPLSVSDKQHCKLV